MHVHAGDDCVPCKDVLGLERYENPFRGINVPGLAILFDESDAKDGVDFNGTVFLVSVDGDNSKSYHLSYMFCKFIS